MCPFPAGAYSWRSQVPSLFLLPVFAIDHLFFASTDYYASAEPARLLATRPDPAEAQRWTLHALEPGDGYVAALAVEAQGCKLCCWEF
jgi:hypothetical protein